MDLNLSHKYFLLNKKKEKLIKLDILKDIIVFDFTSRLPGPLASKMLEQMGAQVFKIELSLDPFSNKESSFDDWYEQINNNKTIVNSIPTMTPHIVLAYKEEHFKQFKNSVKILVRGGRDDFKYLHDLNALSFSKTYQDILNKNSKMPDLPHAGIAYGQYISNVSLALLSQKTFEPQTLYLKDFAQSFFDLFYSESKQKLHEGIYPCYTIYKTKNDDLICFAAVEEKFWSKFIHLSGLNLSLDQRFDTSGDVKQILGDYFLQNTTTEIQQLLQDQHLCISLIKK